MQAGVTSRQGEEGGGARIGERVRTGDLLSAWHWRAQPMGTDGSGSGSWFVGIACFTRLIFVSSAMRLLVRVVRTVVCMRCIETIKRRTLYMKIYARRIHI